MSSAAATPSPYLSAHSAARKWGPFTSTSLVAGDRRKVHTSFPESKTEFIEEYDVNSDDLLIRKYRQQSSLGAWGAWTFEIGEPVNKFNPQNELMAETANNVSSHKTIQKYQPIFLFLTCSN